jgi:hypothetical protein
VINGDPGEERPVEVTGVPPRGPDMLLPLPFQSSARPPAGPPPSVVRSRPGRRAARVAAGALLAAAVAATLLVTAHLDDRRAAPAAATAAAASASPSPSPSPPRPPTARESIDLTLAAQDRALLAGDLDGYLAPVEASLHEWYRTRFTALRTLGVGLWSSRAAEAPAPQPDGQWSMLVESAYCLGATDCRAEQLFVETTWTVTAGRATLTAAKRSTAPWDVTALMFAAGRRVIVAAPERYAGRLAATVAAADKGADVADRFAHWGAPPARYVVYLAGAAEWAGWFRGHDEDAADAFAHGGEVVQRIDRGTGSHQLFAHEFTHVVSLGKRARTQQDWWLVEGLAEYAADRDGAWTKGRLPFVRRYVRQGRWDGSVTLGRIPEGSSDDVWQARYGIALLTVSRLAQRFGEPAMLDFFAAVVRDGRSPEEAAPEVFATGWAAVAADCAAHIRAR